jgi:hypothetical protein
MYLLTEAERVRSERDAADARLARFALTVRHVVDDLPVADKEKYLQQFEAISSGVFEQSRGGEVHGNVIALFKEVGPRQLSVSEVQTALEGKGTPANSKAIHNAINYLTKTGRLQRVSRGRYVSREFGAGLEIEGFDNGTSRMTEHDV